MYGKRRLFSRIRINSLTKFIIVLIVIAILFLFITEVALKPTLRTLAETQSQWTATEVIHKAILEEIASDLSYTDLVIPHKDNNDKVVFMQANIIVVNKLASEAVLKIQQRLEEMRSEAFSIPLGQISGIKLLANMGPKINFRLLPVGTVKVQVSDDFSQAGINQTRHQIFLNISSNMKIVFPLVATDTKIETKVPIADSIIVGPVPDTYMFLDIGAQAKLSDLTEL